MKYEFALGINGNNYNDTDIGLIPADWHVVPLFEVTLKTKQRNPTQKPDEEFIYIDVSSVSNEINKITNYNVILGADAPSRARKAVARGDTLFATVRPYLRNIARVPDELQNAICSTGFCVIRADHELADSDFLFYVVLADSFVERVVGLQKGSSYPAVSDSEVKSQRIPLPPLSEQRRIAAVLNAIQDEIAAQDDIIAEAREFKRSLMQRLFTYGAGAEPAETKETEIGEIPAHWDVAELRDIAEIQSGGTPSRRVSEFYVDGTIPWVKTLDLNNGIVTSTEELITQQALESTNGKVRPTGTVMVAMYGGAGTIGKSGLLAIEAATNQAVCCIEPNANIFIPEYLHYYMVRLRPQWMKYAIGTRKDPNISKTIIENQHVPLPSLDEQKEIASQLSNVDEKIAVEEDRKAAMQDFLKTMLHQLMTGQIRLLSDDGLPL